MSKRWLLTLLIIFPLVSFAGCDLLDDDDPDEVYIKGETGTKCTYDWECRSNSCVYPGTCQ